MVIATEPRLNYEPATVLTPPLVFAKNISDFFSEFLLFCYFRHIFSRFDHLFKDVKVVHVILVRERQQVKQLLKPPKMWTKTIFQAGL
jgi:hypothetical protein